MKLDKMACMRSLQLSWVHLGSFVEFVAFIHLADGFSG